MPTIRLGEILSAVQLFHTYSTFVWLLRGLNQQSPLLMLLLLVFLLFISDKWTHCWLDDLFFENGYVLMCLLLIIFLKKMLQFFMVADFLDLFKDLLLYYLLFIDRIQRFLFFSTYRARLFSHNGLLLFFLLFNQVRFNISNILTFG